MSFAALVDPDAVLAELLMPWHAVLSTVVATVLIYSMLVVILSTSRQRLYGADSVVEFAIVAVLGAVVGRTALGNHPTLATGVVVLLTLGATRMVIAVLRRALYRRSRAGVRGGRAIRSVAPRARVVVVYGEVRVTVLGRLHMPEGELWSQLRAAGVRRPDEVALAIVETGGSLTVFRRGEPIDARILAGVDGVEGLPGRLVAREPARGGA